MLKNFAGDLEPIWSYGTVLPPSLEDLSENDEKEDDGEDDENLVEIMIAIRYWSTWMMKMMNKIY